jgi:hypothetical protein
MAKKPVKKTAKPKAKAPRKGKSARKESGGQTG